MIELRIAGLQLRVHPLAVLLPMLGMTLGLRNEVPALLLSLSIHESGHLLAARLSRVRVKAMTATPFGCGLELGNIYAFSPWQIFAVSIGGPLASLQLLFAATALGRWGLLSPALSIGLMRVTATLLLFNLLPALPLDGGRMLYALTIKPLGRDNAVRLCACLGYGVALCLVVATVWLFVRTHRLNLTLPACAAFMLHGIAEDRRALVDVNPVSLLNALRTSDAPVHIRMCAVSHDYPVLKALRCTAPDAAMLFAVYRDGAPAVLVDERALLNLALYHPDATVEEATKSRFRII